MKIIHRKQQLCKKACGNEKKLTPNGIPKTSKGSDKNRMKGSEGKHNGAGNL